MVSKRFPGVKSAQKEYTWSTTGSRCCQHFNIRFYIYHRCVVAWQRVKIVWSYVWTVIYTCRLRKLNIQQESDNHFFLFVNENLKLKNITLKKRSNYNLRNANIGIRDPKLVKWNTKRSDTTLTTVVGARLFIQTLASINEGRGYLDAMKPELGHTTFELGVCDVFQNELPVLDDGALVNKKGKKKARLLVEHCSITTESG